MAEINPNEIDLYGGFAGVSLDFESFNFGEGIVLSKTYAHLMAPFIMAFSPSQPGKPPPTPYRAAHGGFGADVLAQLEVPKEFTPIDWFDRLNTVWWFAALLRLRATPLLFMPVISSDPFSEATQIEHEIQFWPIEAEHRRLLLEREPSKTVTKDACNWIADHWREGGRLMAESSELNLLFQAFDQSSFASTTSLAMLSLWGALESIFSPSSYELRFRISALIATFLEPPGEERYNLHRRLVKLYDERSKIAHGRSTVIPDSIFETYEITKRIIIKIFETNYVPTTSELDARLFGFDAS